MTLTNIFTLHICAENTPVNEHNKNKLGKLSGSLYILKAKDQYPTNVRKQDIDRVLARRNNDQRRCKSNVDERYQYFW